MKTTISASSPCIQTNIGPKSRFQTTVCLDDWWLVRAENHELQGTRVAIAGRSVGIGVKGKQPMRVFSSLPILKRYDEFTLETTDGKCVIIKGSINKDRTAENGFPSDVCNHFMYGFPSYWKEYAEKFMLIESHCNCVSGVIEELSPPVASEQPLVGSCENNLESQDPMNAKGVETREKTTLTEEILSHTEGRRTTRSMRSLKMELKKKSTKSRDEKIRSNSVSSSMGSDKVHLARVDIKPGECRNKFQFEVVGQNGCANKKSSIELDSGFVKDKFEQIAKTPYREEDLKRVITHGITHKEEQKATSSLGMSSPAYNEKQTVVADSLSENAEASDMKTRKKLAYETPEKEKDKVPTDLPQYRSLNRSRSGRLLMPTLEFWRNQRAIYDADGTVIGIEEEIQEGQPKKGSGYASQRKRRQRL